MSGERQVLVAPRLAEQHQWITASMWKAIELVLGIGNDNPFVTVGVVSVKARENASRNYDLFTVSHEPDPYGRAKGFVIVRILNPKNNSYSEVISVSEGAISVWPFLLFYSARLMRDVYISSGANRPKTTNILEDQSFYVSLIQDLLYLSGSSYRLATGPYEALRDRPGYALISVDSTDTVGRPQAVAFVYEDGETPVTIERGDAPPQPEVRNVRIASNVQTRPKKAETTVYI